MSLFSRRSILAIPLIGGALVSLVQSPPVMAAEPAGVPQAVAETVAIQQIEFLRRQYGRATDLIGLNTPDGIAEGRAIYRRIFTPEASIRTRADEVVGFQAVGPDAWVEVAAAALKVFRNTQHLIGTQIVHIQSLPDAAGEGGEARMSSYLQAWHDDPDRVLDIFIGTYHDKVRYTPGVGWQIYDMELEQVSGAITQKSGVGGKY